MNKVRDKSMDNNPDQRSMSNEQYLRDLYFNPRSPASYSNISKMWREVRSSDQPIKYKEVKA